MEIQCTQENFSRGLQYVGRIATSRSSLPILANVHLTTEDGGIRMSTTDLEIGVSTWIGAKVESEGTITVPARLLLDFISNNNDPTLSIKIDSGEIVIKSERYNAQINGMDAADFPLIPPPGDKKLFSLNSGIFKKALKDIAFSAAVNDSRQVLNGILLRVKSKELLVAGTDSYRLAERVVILDKKAQSELELIIPSRLVLELVRILPDDGELELTLNQNQISFEFASTRVVSRLIEGKYPDYGQIIPKEPQTVVTLDKFELLQAVKVADFFARDNSHNIKILTSDNRILIKAVSANVGKNESQVKADIDGDNVEVAFNAKFIIDGLNALESEKIALEFFGADRPMILRPIGDKNYFNLVMPLRIE